MKYLLIICAFLSSIFLSAAEIKYDSPQTFYAGRETTINIKTDGLNGKNFSWNLKCSGLALASAELAVPESGKVELKFTFPEIRDGVSATAELTCLSGDKKLMKNVFFFSLNPFSFKKKVLEKMKIGLWSPEGDDIAKKTFESLGVVTSEVSNFTDFKGELLIVTGIEFENFSGLEKEIINICSSGSNILIINPKAGTLPLKTKNFINIFLSRNEKIIDYDKNLDTERWGDSPTNARSLNLIPYDSGLAIEVADNRNSFTFMSAKIGKGELFICAWDIFGMAGKSPSPVYLLEKLIFETEKRRMGESEKEKENN